MVTNRWDKPRQRKNKTGSGWYESKDTLLGKARKHSDAQKLAQIKRKCKDALNTPIETAPKLEQTIKAEENHKANKSMSMTPTLEIVFWDVQHGSATYIKTPNGKHIVKDLGTGSYKTNDEKFSPLLHLKQKWRVNQLDYVIITHPHKDHIDDIMNFDELSPLALSRPKHLPRDEIMKNVQKEDEYLFEKYFEIDQRYSSPISSTSDPLLSNNNGGVKIEKFTPNSSSTSNINNHSIVTVLSYADSKVILTGDNEPPSWNELLEIERFKNSIKNADILLAPHHGRNSGFSPELFEYFNPKLTIVSDGRFCDTSATDRYSKISKGWLVHRRNGNEEMRKCVTTRNDGVIVVKLGYNNGKEPFIDVTID